MCLFLRVIIIKILPKVKKMKKILFLISLVSALLMGKESQMKQEVATLGGGCFWCLEAVFEETRGVLDVISGYAGGDIKQPTYE